MGHHVRLAADEREALQPDDPHVHLGALGVDADDRDRSALASHAAGQVERLRVADSLDRQVHAAPLGCRAGSGTRVLLGQVDRLGAERACHLEPILDRVDRNHPRGAARARSHHGAEADGPEAENRAHIAGP